ncbi:MAG: hypothetical protein WCZ27_03035 [Tissierellaceae bacterium]
MRVESVQHTASVAKTEKLEEEKKSPEKSEVKESPAAVYEKTEKSEDKGHIYDKAAVDRLKMDSERTYSSLRRIVEYLLLRQGKSFDTLKDGDLIEVDETARMEAQELIGPEGELGVEKVSQRIVDFAIALSGGDKSKLDGLRKAIGEGFKEAEKILGGLPDISRQTYDRIMEKLDAWEKEE